MSLSLEEQETHINFSGEERRNGEAHIYTDDPVMIRKFDKLGYECVEELAHGGKHYVVQTKQVTFRKLSAKRELTDEQIRRLREQAKANFGI